MKKINVITGAGSGLGREFSRLIFRYFPADELWLFSRTRTHLEKTAELVKAEAASAGAALRLFPADIAGRQGVEQFRLLLERERDAQEGQGGFCIAALVNNAGFGAYGGVCEIEEDAQLSMIELNVMTPAGFCMEALPYMREGSGIINVASLAAFAPMGNFAVYAATKAFVHSFSAALKAEVAKKGVSVCAACPGPVATNFAAVASNGARAEVKGGADPARVAEHALKAAKRGKWQAIMLIKWKAAAFLSRFAPRYRLARWMLIFRRRPRNKERPPNGGLQA